MHKGAMVFHIRERALWYIFYSTGTGTIATVYIQVRAGPEMKGHCM